MVNQIRKTWHDLNRPVLINQRELVLGISACTLAGIVVGILFSPKKAVTIGSHNGNNNGNNNQGSSAGTVNPPDSEDDEDEQEA